MSNEMPRLRRILFANLDGPTFGRINMTALGKATVRLADDGWTAEDIASQVLGDYGDIDPAALIISRTRALIGQPPPHSDSTPTPPPYDRAEVARAMNAAAADPSAWAARVREAK